MDLNDENVTDEILCISFINAAENKTFFFDFRFLIIKN